MPTCPKPPNPVGQYLHMAAVFVAAAVAVSAPAAAVAAAAVAAAHVLVRGDTCVRVTAGALGLALHCWHGGGAAVMAAWAR